MSVDLLDQEGVYEELLTLLAKKFIIYQFMQLDGNERFNV